ncbi:hypothetical protein AVEN_113009-1 [Araneus ventricosus]|uniref:Uncharacterized protein n=1 Tax=Araneus ventricosus TaxID=182803 RepID=A0A4Y2LC29_ARAVE|nr:hypothetical protein AVEN_113009-1 [Araneus ventricosus]
MGRYLCQLCYTIVNYGEMHPCFAYKNNDDVYSLPELSESNKKDTKHGELTANSEDNSVLIFPEEQPNNAEIPEQRSTWLTESHRQFSLRDASKTRGRSHSFSSMVSNTEQGNPSNTLLSGPLFNVSHALCIQQKTKQPVCGIRQRILNLRTDVKVTFVVALKENQDAQFCGGETKEKRLIIFLSKQPLMKSAKPRMKRAAGILLLRMRLVSRNHLKTFPRNPNFIRKMFLQLRIYQLILLSLQDS